MTRLRFLVPGDRGTCPVCSKRGVLVTRGGLRRHAGSTSFDLATDGVCSGSHGPPLEDLPTTPGPTTCQRCSRSIEWVPDDLAEPTIGWWVAQATGSEVCVPGPNDEDGWHQPVGAFEVNGWPA